MIREFLIEVWCIYFISEFLRSIGTKESVTCNKFDFWLNDAFTVLLMRYLSEIKCILIHPSAITSGGAAAFVEDLSEIAA